MYISGHGDSSGELVHFKGMVIQGIHPLITHLYILNPIHPTTRKDRMRDSPVLITPGCQQLQREYHTHTHTSYSYCTHYGDIRDYKVTNEWLQEARCDHVFVGCMSSTSYPISMRANKATMRYSKLTHSCCL